MQYRASILHFLQRKESSNAIIQLLVCTLRQSSCRIIQVPLQLERANEKASISKCIFAPAERTATRFLRVKSSSRTTTAPIL